MKLVNPTEKLSQEMGYPDTVRFLKTLGFDGVDMSFFDMFEDGSIWCRDDYREYAREIKNLGDEIGISFEQAHAPFPSSRGNEEFDTMAFSKIVRSMEIASILGIPRIVVHPLQHMPYIKNKKKLFNLSVEFYRRLIPYCEKFNIQVCCENMWQWGGRRKVIIDSICSQPEEFLALLEEVDSPWIVACLDIGHCALVGVDPADAIRILGKKHLKALHVHDVDYIKDCHTMPFTEELDWESVAAALAEIGYEGNFTFEANEFFGKFPVELWKDAGILLEKTGRYIMDRIEKNRK